MFFEVFAASALATILFGGGKIEQKNYDYQFSQLNDAVKELDKKIDMVFDNTRFMRARMCLQEFSPKLLDEVRLSDKCHTPIKIMKAAEEGFNILLDVAKADENNFKEAREIFKQTYGNIEWVTEKYGSKCEEFSKDLTEVNEKLSELNIQLEKIITEFSKLALNIANNVPKNIFKSFTMNHYKKKCLNEIFNFFKNNTINENYYNNEFDNLYYLVYNHSFSIIDYVNNFSFNHCNENIWSLFITYYGSCNFINHIKSCIISDKTGAYKELYRGYCTDQWLEFKLDEFLKNSSM